MTVEAGLFDVEFLHAGFSLLHSQDGWGPYELDCWEFCWLHEGEATATYDGEPHLLEPGSVLLLPPRTTNTYVWGPSRPVRQGSITFRAAVGPDRPLLRTLVPDDVVLALLRHVAWLSILQPRDWRTTAARTTGLAFHAMVSGHSETSTANDPPFPAVLVRALTEVRTQWRTSPLRTPTLDELAAMAGVSREHLSRIGARALGMGLSTAFRIVRLNRAAMLLIQSDLSMSQIAAATGFASESHFARQFRAHTGMSPLRYRASGTRAFRLPEPLRVLAGFLAMPVATPPRRGRPGATPES